jgi:ribosomal protein S18 acetylase RimI-like enzyme
MEVQGIRRARPQDNAALLSLFRSCPMAADISLRIDRDPDFFALGRARGDSETLLVEEGDGAVGCVSTWRRRGWLGGAPADIGYFGDLRIHPRYRRRGIAAGLGRAALDRLPERPAAVYLTTTAAGNRAADALLARFAAGSVIEVAARFTSWQLLPLWRSRIPAGLEIGAAEAGDEPALVELLDDFHRRRSFAPVFSDNGLQSVLASSPGLRLSDYLVARRRGRVTAAVGVWDATAVKQTHVVGMPWLLRAAFALGRGLGGALGWSPFPAPGDRLRFRYLRHPAYRDDDVQALGALVRVAVNAARARRDHFLLFTCADDDPLRRAVEGIPRSTYHYVLRAGSDVPDRPPRLPPASPDHWFFDDAALA